jgi:hypothetical protein
MTEYVPPKTVDELLSRYHAGERMFRKTQLYDEVIETSMPGVDFEGSSLRVLFNDVVLSGASFRNADLAFAQFDAALIGANFDGADLPWADLGWSNLKDTTFRGARLRNATFKGANLIGADFENARLDGTAFLDVDLSSLAVSTGVIHEGPSYVDHRTVLRSIRSPALGELLSRLGTPAIFVEFMTKCASSIAEPTMSSLLQSTFISYGEPDAVFARRLNEALHANGVRTFFFPEHAVPGKKLHRTMREGVNQFDRVLLICSKNSLSRRGVLNEVEETLAREARDGGASYLIPILLDDWLFEPAIDPSIGRAICDRVASDFRDPTKFDSALAKLIGALSR